MGNYGWLFWVAAMVLFGIMEAATVNLVSVWFVGGALAALVVQLLGGGVWFQIIVFLLVAGGLHRVMMIDPPHKSGEVSR